MANRFLLNLVQLKKAIFLTYFPRLPNAARLLHRNLTFLLYELVQILRNKYFMCLTRFVFSANVIFDCPQMYVHSISAYLDLSVCLSVYVYIFGSRSAAFSQCVPIIIIIVWYMMMEVFHAAFAGGAKEVTSPPPPSLQSSQSLRLGFLKLWSFKP